MGFWMLLACMGEPHVMPSEVHGQDVVWYLLSLDSVAIGSEAWSFEGEARIRRRETAWTVDGVLQRRDHALRLEPAADGWWRTLDAAPPEHVGWVPEMGPPRAGRGEVVDPFGSATRTAEIVVVDDAAGKRLSVDGPLGPTEAWFDAAGLVGARMGRLRLARVDGPPRWTPPELTELLALPVPAWGEADPRRARVARWTVDGESVAVVRPLTAELPHVPLPDVGPGSDAVRRWAEGLGQDEVWTLTQALVRRVPETLTHRPRLDPVTPTELLSDPWGDCTEHVALFVEAAAARGVAARPITGLLLVPHEGAGRLVPHAWAEVEVGGRWVAVDPTLAQAPADAGRLRIPGETQAPWALTPSIRLLDLR